MRQNGGCLACGKPLKDRQCESCDLPFEKQFYVGPRDGVLKELVNVFKFQSVRAVGRELAYLLAEMLPPDVVVVPLPTISKHVRARGFDHMKTITRHLAVLRSDLRVDWVLRRINKTIQVGASAEQRQEQAASAYSCGAIDVAAHYLLLDDIWTTGASMKAAATVLRQAGAKNVSCAVIARSV